MKLFGIQIKIQRFFIPLLVLVALSQVALGWVSSDALSSKSPNFTLGIQQLGHDALSEQLVVHLQDLPEVAAVMIDPQQNQRDALREYNIQGIVVIPESFDNDLQVGRQNLVEYCPAPGIVDSSLMIEHISDSIMKVQADLALEKELESLGITNPQLYPEDSRSIISVEQANATGGLQLQSTSAQEAPPAFEVSALLLLLALLYAVSVVPAREDKLLLMKGRRALGISYASALGAALVFWAFMIALYLTVFALCSHALVPPLVISALFLILLYMLLLGGVLAQVVNKQVIVGIFAALFLLNMTIGGGLWGEVVGSAALCPLLPVSSVTLAIKGEVSGIVILGVSCVVLIVATVFLVFRNAVQQGNADKLSPQER